MTFVELVQDLSRQALEAEQAGRHEDAASYRSAIDAVCKTHAAAR